MGRHAGMVSCCCDGEEEERGRGKKEGEWREWRVESQSVVESQSCGEIVRAEHNAMYYVLIRLLYRWPTA
jgi:hypothetical protein